MTTPYVGRWWHRADERVICDLCPRRCHLGPGQRGFCYVRSGSADGVVLDTYGRSSGFCIDPIEKKPLFHFLPGTPVLSFGTAGCNLGCRFCQNWEISKAREDDTLADSASPDAIADAAVRTGCRSVAFTYNDPVIFAEYAIAVAVACRARGVATVAKTAGYITPEARGEFFGAMDAANIDLKAFTERFYRELCFARLEPVKETIVALAKERRLWLELTTLLIPGENDSDAEITALCDWVGEELGPDVPLHFTAYHPDFKLRNPATTPSLLRHARTIGLKAGLHYVYVGNVLDAEGESTHCPGCGKVLVSRSTYDVTGWDIVAPPGAPGPGRCPGCQTLVPGRFETEPGHWGTRRQPVRLGHEHWHAVC